ncbi:Gldg family protein [Treponema pectinovorum]|uniref:Gldg family protein n=1 Tax=Treponema pectinovorum TaxID=164 RepID=UPI003D90259B
MNKSLLKSSIYFFLIDPLFYFCSMLTVLFTAFSYFFLNKFFVITLGSTSLISFFTVIAHCFTITVPILVYRLKAFTKDDSFPISSFSKFLTLAFSSFCAAFFPLALLGFIPLAVNSFGNVEIAEAVLGYLGICLFLWTACSFSIFIISLVKKEHSLVGLFLCICLLFCFNFIHLLPLYARTGDFFSFLMKNLSFAWHFDSFSKGILDTRDLYFYILASSLFLSLACIFENKRIELKVQKLTIFLLVFNAFFLTLALNNIYFRFDFTKNKQYSISKVTYELANKLENPLRIRYFRSKELKQYYPQSEEVVEYLKSLVFSNKNFSLTIENAEPQKMQNLGIEGRQLKTENSTKVEYSNVYSAILLQYLDRSTIIPFALSTKTLEYDIAQRIQQLITENERRIYIVAGNGFSLEEDYAYLIPWLASRGFFAEELPLKNLVATLENLQTSNIKKTQILLLGSKELSLEQSLALKNACESGASLLALTSPYTIDVRGDWNATKNENDSFISVLNNWGFAFDFSLAQDLSNFPLTLSTGEEKNVSLKTINYPLWISTFPQKKSPEGLTFFWASPILCYQNAKPLIVSTKYAWKQEPSNDAKNLFIINPFLIPKTAQESQAKNQILTLSAIKQDLDKNLGIAVIADQYFVSSLMTGFTSTTQKGDFRNYDYVVNLLLTLKNEEELAVLMEKMPANTSLYKIQDESEFLRARKNILIVCFFIIPLFIILFAIFFMAARLIRNRGSKNEQ